VASRLYDTYLKQIFVTNFVHADPHPGNLFVRALPADRADGPQAPEEKEDGVPFQVVFIDFGMVAVIPERLREQLRSLLIGLSTRDSHRIVQAYADAGILLPGADRRQLEEMYDAMFERMWGVKLGEMRDAAVEQMGFLWREYRDLMYEMPFQLPSDVLFVGRAIGVLSGIATQLNPDFDPWTETMPFAEKLAAQELSRDLRGWLDEIVNLLRLITQMPARMDRFMNLAEQGRLVVQAGMAPDALRSLRRVERSVDRLTWGVIFLALLISGVLLRVNEGPDWLNSVMLAGAGISLLVGLTKR
jgi:predicted unusual protein kinase regulating ubiquinone biosynthesis (AarF/ABC1/UbiB family)